MNTDNTVVRLSDESAKMPFSKLIALYTPVETPPVDENVPPDNVPDDAPPAVDDVPPEQPTPVKPPIQTEPEKPTINPCNVYLCFKDPDVKNFDSLIVALKNGVLDATFFFSAEYIEKNPEKVATVYADGYSIGLYAKNTHADYDGFYAEITAANDYLERIVKQKTRLVASDGVISEYRVQLEKKGYLTHQFEITPSKYIYYSKTLANNVISGFNSYSKPRVLMNSDITSVSSLYEIAKHINSYGVIASCAIDETF